MSCVREQEQGLLHAIPPFFEKITKPSYKHLASPVDIGVLTGIQ
jgi:hypothetical protein